MVQLDGGNDGLNTVVPYRDDEYRKRRPRLAIAAAEVKKVDDHVGLHPRSRRSRSCWSNIGWRSCRAWAIRTRTGRTSRAWRSGRRRGLNPDKAAPGWLARAIDRRPGPDGDAPGLHIHESFPLPRCAGGRPAGGAVAGPTGAVPPPAGRCPQGSRAGRAGRGPRSPGAPGPRRARLAAPVRRAVQPDHVCQQCAARDACSKTARPPGIDLPRILRPGPAAALDRPA